jgi:hypothetical protein
MIYIKSAIAGILALTVAGFVSRATFFIKHRPDAEGTPGWDPISVMKSQIAWIINLVVFGAGFYWEFRRAAP